MYVFSISFPYWVRMWGGRGSPKSLVHNLLMQYLTMGSSKTQCFETYFFHIMTTQNDNPRYVKHIFGSNSVFFIFIRSWLPLWGGEAPHRIGMQPANAVFHCGKLKNLSVRNLFS